MTKSTEEKKKDQCSKMKQCLEPGSDRCSNIALSGQQGKIPSIRLRKPILWGYLPYWGMETFLK